MEAAADANGAIKFPGRSHPRMGLLPPMTGKVCAIRPNFRWTGKATQSHLTKEEADKYGVPLPAAAAR